MDRVFDEYLLYLKESVNEEDAAKVAKPGRKGRKGARRGGQGGKNASRSLGRYREATGRGGSATAETEEFDEA